MLGKITLKLVGRLSITDLGDVLLVLGSQFVGPALTVKDAILLLKHDVRAGVGVGA